MTTSHEVGPVAAVRVLANSITEDTDPAALADPLADVRGQLDELKKAHPASLVANNVESVEFSLDGVFSSLEKIATTRADYLSKEAEVKQAMDSGERADMIGLDRARENFQDAPHEFRSNKSTLNYGIDVLASAMGED